MNLAKRRVFLATLGVLFCVSSLTRAQTSYPMLMSLQPVAAQVGTTSEHTIHSRYTMYGANEVIVSGAGVRGEIVHPEKKPADKEKVPALTTMKIRFHVDNDAMPGVRDFRISTPRGASTLGQVVIGIDTVVVESADNNTLEKATEVTLPATICGQIEKAEDVDVYRFDVAANQRLTFHVRSMRLQNRIHDLQQHSDPILTLRNAAGVTLATSDNVFHGDPFVAFEFSDAGQYFLELRDVRYQGNKYWEYSIEASDRPFLTNVYPLAIAAGKAASLSPIGVHIPSVDTVNVTAPPVLGPTEMALEVSGVKTNPAPVVVTDLELVEETAEANDDCDSAMLVSFPAGINGRLDQAADIDCYAFEATKGETISVEVCARRHGSKIDSYLSILDSSGKRLKLSDDLVLGKRNYSDSWIENWVVPADGRYVIEIRDLHLRGGPDFVYFVKLTRAVPYFELYLDTDKTQLAPGMSGVLFVRVVRKNGYVGTVDLSVEGLPVGVLADCGRILGGKGIDGCIVLTATAEAEMGMANIRVFGRDALQVVGEELSLGRTEAVTYQETYMPGGGRGHFPVSFHTVSVGEANDLRSVKLSEYDVVMKPGESRKIEVKLERAPGFDKNVSLSVLFNHLSSTYGNSLPEGVTVDAGASNILLTKGAIEGHIVLKAAENAPTVSRQQISVMASVSLNFVMKATYSSGPLFVTVE
jgi:hypothetical protein